MLVSETLARVLEPDHLQHHRHRLGDKDAAHDAQHDLLPRDHGDGAQRTAQRQRAHVAHEDLRREIVLGIMGGVFVAEMLSVMIQVGWFKYTKKKYGEGRRVFLMAPLHHHFEKKGWAETQVVVRFWIITMLLCLVGLASLKLR